MAAINSAHDNNPKDTTLIISPEWKTSHVAALHPMLASSDKVGMLQPISSHVGGTGGDFMTGGAGKDMFVFKATNESNVGSRR